MKTAQRLFLGDDLAPGAAVGVSSDQFNYLINVLRLGVGDEVLLFNGRDGEWTAAISQVTKRAVTLTVSEQRRPQLEGPDLQYLFAPLKHARLDYMVQKATELGVAALRPVLTERTQSRRVNLERMHANAVEAAEQCGVLRVPSIAEPVELADVLANWPAGRALVFCDENATVGGPLHALSDLARHQSVAVLIGPEGGFAPAERALLLSHAATVPISLGPRIMRADTAAVAALALVNATLGDWY
jgi:16S rRNA (uracil1498-N3)-methyltransferase